MFTFVTLLGYGLNVFSAIHWTYQIQKSSSDDVQMIIWMISIFTVFIPYLTFVFWTFKELYKLCGNHVVPFVNRIRGNIHERMMHRRAMRLAKEVVHEATAV